MPCRLALLTDSAVTWQLLLLATGVAATSQCRQHASPAAPAATPARRRRRTGARTSLARRLAAGCHLPTRHHSSCCLVDGPHHPIQESSHVAALPERYACSPAVPSRQHNYPAVAIPGRQVQRERRDRRESGDELIVVGWVAQVAHGSEDADARASQVTHQARLAP